jgi:ubiquinone/menaquinone biosynthesis C-methylase UbiE
MKNLPPQSIHAWMRYEAIQRLLGRLSPRTVLEIGVGQGSVGVLLAERFDDYVGIDLDERSIGTARDRFRRHGLDDTRLLQGGLEQVSARQFDLVCAFEVLEHLEDDQAALQEWSSFLTRGGAVLLSVPAGPGRFGKADEKAGHFRRYSRSSIERVLGSAGFTEVHVLNYGFPAGYVLEVARNMLARRELRKGLTYEQRTLASGRWLQPPDAMSALTRAIAIPLGAIQRPFMVSNRGTGLVALATRP